MWFAERTAARTGTNAISAWSTRSHRRRPGDVSLAAGVSRSGATISAGLLRGLDRVTATKVSFYLSIPGLMGAGLFNVKDLSGSEISVGQVVVGTIVSFVVAYAVDRLAVALRRRPLDHVVRAVSRDRRPRPGRSPGHRHHQRDLIQSQPERLKKNHRLVELSAISASDMG